MTWGECKLAALRTMFANEGMVLTVDDSNQEYVNAMPEKANEALQMLAIAARPILRRSALTAEEEETVDLKELFPDFRAIDEVTRDGESAPYALEADRYLRIQGGTYTIVYAAYPEKITAETEDETEIDIAPECAVLLPLYIASELYKEDELATATIWRNEFEDGLEKVRKAYGAQGGGMKASTRASSTGWW